MHVTACVAGQEDVDVEVGEACRSLRALKEAIVEALPKLCAEGFDVSVGGRALDDDEGVVSLEDSMRLDVVPNARIRSVLALREAGREVSEAGLFAAAEGGDVVGGWRTEGCRYASDIFRGNITRKRTDWPTKPWIGRRGKRRNICRRSCRRTGH